MQDQIQKRIMRREGTAIISFRVRKSIKKRLERLPKRQRLDILKTLSKSLEEFEREHEAEKTIERLKALMKKRSKPSKAGFAEQSVREDRYESY